MLETISYPSHHESRLVTYWVYFYCCDCIQLNCFWKKLLSSRTVFNLYKIRHYSNWLTVTNKLTKQPFRTTFMLITYDVHNERIIVIWFVCNKSRVVFLMSPTFPACALNKLYCLILAFRIPTFPHFPSSTQSSLWFMKSIFILSSSLVLVDSFFPLSLLIVVTLLFK